MQSYLAANEVDDYYWLTGGIVSFNFMDVMWDMLQLLS
jgi:hypothetical protein